MKRRLVLGAVVGVAFVLLTPLDASAHPLGNFTVNHYHGLSFDANGLSDMAVVDTAEIPTAQARDTVDTNHDGQASLAERSAYAHEQCAALVRQLQVTIGQSRLAMRVLNADFAYRPGQAGLDVSRLVCQLRGDVALSQLTTVRFADAFEAGRVGWREITAVARGVHLIASPVPATSVTNALTSYPNDLLSSPLDVRDATINVQPGAGNSTLAASIKTVSKAGPFTRLIDRVTGTFNGLVGKDHLTLSVGLLAVGLALLLGASHAVLPGHGKTVMAAYIAGRQGSMRDAFMVGATVTVTHTAGVIILGLALTVSSSLAGDAVLRWLGVSSGLLVAALGISLLVNAIRHTAPSHGHSHGPMSLTHPHDHQPFKELVHAGHAHGPHDPHEGRGDHDHHHGDHGHVHPGQLREEGRSGQRVLSRRGLIAMGVAGGLVPSPSALVVLLAAIALGRTIFGVALVVCYGIGMAGTLTATGLILVKLRDKYEGRAAERFSRRFAIGWTRFIPFTTGTIVVVVGLLLATRSMLGTA